MTKPPATTLSAPLPVPRRFTLLDAATIVPDASGRTPNGANVEDYPGAQVSVQEAFASGSARVKAIDAEIGTEEVVGFTVYLGVTCTTVSVARREAEFRRRLQAAFRAVESAAVERILVDAGGTALGAYLTDANLEQLASGGAVSPVEGLALLENAIAEVGNGMIHVTPATATALASRYLIEEARDGQMRTRLGTLVAVGAGYIGAYPGVSVPTGDQEWAFASGFVEVHRDEDQIIAGTLGQSLDRSANDVTFIAERNYLVSWVGRQDSGDDKHVQAGVLIDRSA